MSQQAVPKNPATTSMVELLLIRLGAAKNSHAIVMLMYTRVRHRVLKSRSDVGVIRVIHFLQVIGVPTALLAFAVRRVLKGLRLFRVEDAECQPSCRTNLRIKY